MNQKWRAAHVAPRAARPPTTNFDNTRHHSTLRQRHRFGCPALKGGRFLVL
jgi:hypothetical protein